MAAPDYDVSAPIPIPDLACAKVTATPGGICITFPGGVQLCAQAGLRFGDTAALTESLFASINAALMPLQPFFNIIDVFVAIMNCIQAIPQSLVPVPNPKPIADCIKGLGEALAKLLAMLPILSVPRLVKGILLAIVLALSGLKNELLVLIEQQKRIADAATKAAEPGNLTLQTVVDCATGNFDVQMANLNAGLAPLNRLIGLINVLLKLIPNGPTVPSLADLGTDAEQALHVLDDALSVLSDIANAIPVPP
jgi:hypothetical protein